MKTLNYLEIGTLVKLGSIYGKPIVWKIAAKNHPLFPDNSVTLVTERIIKLACFDAREPGNDKYRDDYGNNRYKDSNIRQWANSDAPAGSWYTAQHSADAPPTTANCANYNGYDTSAGFLNEFTANEKAALLSTTLTVGKASVDGGGTETVTDKIFLLSGTEVGLSTDYTEGSKLALFSDNNSRIAMPTADAVAGSSYTNTSLAVTKGWYYWLRTPYASYSCDVRSVSTSGTLGIGTAYYGLRGGRFACNLSSDLLVSEPDQGGIVSMPELTDSKKPADWVTLEYKEGQNLFDDYFKAALRGVSTVAACTIAGDVPMKAAGFAMEIAKEAMKKREEYFSELAMRHQ